MMIREIRKLVVGGGVSLCWCQRQRHPALSYVCLAGLSEFSVMSTVVSSCRNSTSRYHTSGKRGRHLWGGVTFHYGLGQVQKYHLTKTYCSKILEILHGLGLRLQKITSDDVRPQGRQAKNDSLFRCRNPETLPVRQLSHIQHFRLKFSGVCTTPLSSWYR